MTRAMHTNPSSSPERNWNQPSSATDGNEVVKRAARAGRVQWTSSLDKSLLGIWRELGSKPKGEDLERLWRERHPQFRSTCGALRTRYHRIKDRSEYNTAQTIGASADGVGEPQTAGAETSHASPPVGLASSLVVSSPQGLEEEQDQEFGGQQPQDDQNDDQSQRPDAAVVEVVQAEEPPSEQPDELREEFLKVLGEVRKGGEGNLTARKRPACQGIKVDEHLLKQVDEFIDELYLGGGRTWWELNCLVYAGADVVENRARKSLPLTPATSP